MPHLIWRVLVRDDVPAASRRALGAQRSSVVAVLGLCARGCSPHAWAENSGPLLLLLVEDMALFGRVGYVRRLIARTREQRVP